MSSAIVVFAVSPSAPATPGSHGKASAQTSVRVRPTAHAVVNFRELARSQPERVQHTTPSVAPYVAPPPASSSPVVPNRTETHQEAAAPSPSPARSYLGLDDIPKAGSGFIVIPPDTDGAVGPNHFFVTLNNNYRVLNKNDGSIVSTVNINTFWASVDPAGGGTPFDPKTLYDPYNNRWLLTAMTDAASANSAILIAISDTTDPTGTYHLYAFDADAANTHWADYPGFGFNKNWVAITVNMFRNSDNVFLEGRILLIDYPTLRTNPASLPTTYISNNTFFTLQPAATYSATEETLYGVESQPTNPVSKYEFWTVTGTPSSPTLTSLGLKDVPIAPFRNHTIDGDVLPQKCDPAVGGACPATTRRVNAGDTRILNAVFRNGGIYYAQTIGISSDPATTATAHTAAQWAHLNTSGDVVQAGRVEDPTATATNGGTWYAYPSIAVNAEGDILVGFSEAESDDYIDAAYSFHDAADPLGTMRDPVVFKEGEDYYEKCFSGTRNRWGDYSATMVDPDDDMDMWTIQEYAKARVGTGTCASTTGDTGSRWSTWVAEVELGPTVSLGPDVSQTEGTGGTTNFTFDVTRTTGAGTSTVQFSTADGTAVAGSDYTPATNVPVTFAPGQTTAQITVSVNPDSEVEPNETFLVNLSPVSNAEIADAQAQGTIQNDDTLPTLSIGDVSQAEGDSGQTAFTFTITRAGNLAGASSVNVSTADGTATAATGDYQSLSATTVSFAATESTKTVTVQVNGDTAVEGDETFLVNLAGESGATVADGQGLGTIQNDDATPPTTVDVRVTMTGTPATAKIGGKIVYKITTQNDGTGPATAVRLRDTAPGSLLIVRARPAQSSDTCTVVLARLTCNLGTLAPGESALVTLVTLPTTAGQLTNVARGSTSSADAVAGNNSDSVQTAVVKPACTVSGTPVADVLRGTARKDVLCAKGGKDIVRGRGGNDVLFGLGGGDTLVGGVGFDVVIGGGGGDSLVIKDGRRRNDAAYGGPGGDTCVRDPGDIGVAC